MTLDDNTALSSLQDHVTGQVLMPDHPEYDKTRQAWNLTVEHYPTLILLPENADDIAAAVRFACDAGLSIAVQSTGHGQKYDSHNNILIITSPLNAVEVDPQARTARAQAGAVWQHVIDAAAPHGLAPLLGSAPHVGVVGYSLGGGVGWLSRQYGFAADSIREIELVTGQGDLIHASATENPELFWGLRGGGGSFGVVTAITFELYPVATIYGGVLTYPGENIAEMLRFFRDWTHAAPDALSGWFRIMKFPDLPQLPEAIRGKTLVLIEAVYLGTEAEGALWIQPWLDWKMPVSNTFREMPFAEIGTVTNDPTKPIASIFSSEMFNELSDSAINALVQQATDRNLPFVINELRHLGGAVSRIDPASTAITHRDAQYYFQIAAPRLQGVYTSEDKAAVETARQRYKAGIDAYVTGGIYLSFTSGDEARNRLLDAYPSATLARLLELKRQYDPTNLFRYSGPLSAEK